MKISDLFFLLNLVITCFIVSPSFAESTKEEIACQLDQMGYDVLRVSNSGDNALHLATKKLNLDAIKLLIEYGISFSRTNKAGDTPLHIASSKGHLEICQYLVDIGADINLENALGQTPYHKALKKPFPGLISFFEAKGYCPKDPFTDYLIAHDLNPDFVDSGNNQLIHRLAKSKNLELARKTLESGFSPNIINKKGESPLTLALKNQDLEMVQLLVEYKAIFNRADVVLVIKKGWIEGLRFIFTILSKEHVAQLLNWPNENGIAPIHYACLVGDLEVLSFLIECGADVNLLTKSEYHYGPRDPVRWNNNDRDAWGEFGNPSDLDRYRVESGYIHPVASPLAIVMCFHSGEADLLKLLIDMGAQYVFHYSIQDQQLADYLK